jgi:hypothetical protein
MKAFETCLFGRYAERPLLELWDALETLFSPGSSELWLRISANVATFLEPL